MVKPNQKHRNKAITDKLLRIESSLLGGGERLPIDWCSNYISWAIKFNALSPLEGDYFATLVLYAIGHLTVEEEEELMEAVKTRRWRFTK